MTEEKERTNTNKRLNTVFWKFTVLSLVAGLIAAIVSWLKEIQRRLSGFPEEETKNKKEK